MEITNNQEFLLFMMGGRDTFEESVKSLSIRGLMVSFGQSSGMIEKIDMHKHLILKAFFILDQVLWATLDRAELLNC